MVICQRRLLDCIVLTVAPGHSSTPTPTATLTPTPTSDGDNCNADSRTEKHTDDQTSTDASSDSSSVKTVVEDPVVIGTLDTPKWLKYSANVQLGVERWAFDV